MGILDKAITRALRQAVVQSAGGASIDLEKIGDVISSVIDDSVEHIGARLQRDAPAMLAEHRALHDDFVARNRDRWSEAFDLLETFVVISQEAGEAFSRQHSRAATRRQDHRLYALTCSHARACLLTREVLCLLVNGYPDGAHARWRALHEVAVVATFLSNQPIETSERYLAHEYTERRRAAEEYQQHCVALGYPPMKTSELRRVERLRAAFLARFGDAFDRPFGWAAEALGKKSVTLKDVEEHIGLEHMRPWYRFASHGVHAGPIGLRATLGLTGAKQEVLLAGPSNSGMADPANLTAIALHQVTAALFAPKPSADELIILRIMQQMIPRLAAALMKGHRKRGPKRRPGRKA